MSSDSVLFEILSELKKITKYIENNYAYKVERQKIRNENIDQIFHNFLLKHGIKEEKEIIKYYKNYVYPRKNDGGIDAIKKLHNKAQKLIKNEENKKYIRSWTDTYIQTMKLKNMEE